MVVRLSFRDGKNNGDPRIKSLNAARLEIRSRIKTDAVVPHRKMMVLLQEIGDAAVSETESAGVLSTTIGRETAGIAGVSWKAYRATAAAAPSGSVL